MAAQLREVLGITAQAAQRLLQETGGDVEGAIALHLAEHDGQNRPGSPRSRLIAVLGSAVNQQQAQTLLTRTGGNVEAAVDLFFEEGAPAETGARQRGISAPSMYSVETSWDSPSSEEEHDDDEAEREEEAQPPPSARRSGGRSSGRGLVRSPRAAGHHAALTGTLRSLLNAMGARAAAPVGVPRFNTRLVGFGLQPSDPYPSSSDPAYSNGWSEEESDEEQEEEPEVLRMHPKIHERLPDLSVAAANCLQRCGPGAVPPEALPLPALRELGSTPSAAPRLHSTNQADVPALARPLQPLSWPLRLGEVLLPLHSVSRQQLHKVQGQKAWSELEWNSKKGQLLHDYLSKLAGWPSWLGAGRAHPLSAAVSQGQASHYESHAQLALYGTTGSEGDLVARVDDSSSWVSELLYSLWVLETAGILELAFSLVGPQQAQRWQEQQRQPGKQQQQQQQEQEGSPEAPASVGQGDGASAAGGVTSREETEGREEEEDGRREGSRRSRTIGKKTAAGAPKRGRSGAAGSKRSRSVGAAAARGAGPGSSSRRCSAGPAGGGGPGRGRGRGSRSRSASATPADQAGPSSNRKGRAAAAAATAAAAEEQPSHVLVKVELTKQALTELWWDGESGELEADDGKGSRGRSKQSMSKARHAKHGSAMARVVTALLQHGCGLCLGPDADALLNFGDTRPEEWQAVQAEDAAVRRREFDVDRLLGSVSLDKGAPAALAPPGLLAHPKHYQLTGLQWMLERERQGDALGRGQAHLHPAWLQLVTADGQLLYMHRLRPHLLSGNFYTAPIGGTCGGFLCDEMGLGKTLEALMLAVSNPAPKGWAVRSLEGQTFDVNEGEPVPIKCTLVVVPANLLNQWAEEIERHLEPGVLSWCRYLPPNSDASTELGDQANGIRLRPHRHSRRMAEEETRLDTSKRAAVKPVICVKPDGTKVPMHEADLVLMSYEQLRDQLHGSAGSVSLLHQYGFWRVLLDEAQLVANSSSVAALMASSLWRRHAWVVTGTPITAQLAEIRGLLEFLAYEPFYHSAQWRGLMQQGYEERSAPGLLSLRALLRGVMLRRSKADVADELDLPPCTREDRWVTLSSVERLVYEQSKRTFIDAAYQLAQHAGTSAAAAAAAAAGNAGPNRARLAGRVSGRTLSALTALRQSCCHPQIVRRTDDTMGKERLSMRQIMDRLVTQAFGEWDQALRRMADAKLLHAAVACGAGGFPGQRMQAVLDMVRASALAASNADVRQQVSERRMDGSAASAEQQEQEQQQQQQQQRQKAGPSGQPAAEGASSDKAAVTAGQVAPSEQGSLGSGASPGMDDAAVGSTRSGAASRKRRRSEDRDDQQQQDLEQQQQHQQQQQECDKGKLLLQQGPPDKGKQPMQGVEMQVDPPQRAPAANDTDAAASHGAVDGAGPSTAAETEAVAGGGAAEVSGKVELSEEEKEARARLRAWKKLELDCLELIAHMLRNCGSGAGGSKARGKAGKPPRAPRRQKRSRGGNGTTVSAEVPAVAAAVEDGSANDAEAGPANEPPPSRELLDVQLSEAAAAIAGLRAELGLAESAVAEGKAAIRRSRRKQGIDAESNEEVFVDVEEAQEQLLNAKLVLRSYNETLARRDPLKSARTAVAAAEKELSEKWHHLRHMVNKEAALLAAEKGKGAAAGPADGPAAAQAADPASGALVQDDMTSCPICLDEISMRTITACGHHYCSPCIREVLSSGHRPCPICRTEISEADLFEAMSEEEARAQAAAKEAATGANGDYGAKVSALLQELAVMRTADPTAKAVVFSSWGRLLKLVGDALTQNGVQHTTLAGATPAQREEALHAFVHDPQCAVLTVVMSTSGGAAGLTLTVAHTAFILEPSLNPGLEAQAAARIYRLGQDKPTRVVRFLAADTVEAQILEVQRRKVESGQAAAELAAQEVDAGMLLQLYDALKDGAKSS